VQKFVRDFNFGFRLGWADPDTAHTLMNGRNVIRKRSSSGAMVTSSVTGAATRAGKSRDHLEQVIDRALKDTTASAKLNDHRCS